MLGTPAVRIAIELNDKAVIVIEEVDNVPADAVLSAKFEIKEASTSEPGPEQSFWERGVLSKLLGR